MTKLFYPVGFGYGNGNGNGDGHGHGSVGNADKIRRK